MTSKLRRKIALAVTAAAIVMAPVALADATTSVYDSPGKKTQDTIGKTTKPVQGVKAVSVSQTSAKPATGVLPFTGMDLGFVALGGAALAGMGYSLRRLARDSDR